MLIMFCALLLRLELRFVFDCVAGVEEFLFLLLPPLFLLFFLLSPTWPSSTADSCEFSVVVVGLSGGFSVA